MERKGRLLMILLFYVKIAQPIPRTSMSLFAVDVTQSFTSDFIHCESDVLHPFRSQMCTYRVSSPRRSRVSLGGGREGASLIIQNRTTLKKKIKYYVYN